MSKITLLDAKNETPETTVIVNKKSKFIQAEDTVTPTLTEAEVVAVVATPVPVQAESGSIAPVAEAPVAPVIPAAVKVAITPAPDVTVAGLDKVDLSDSLREKYAKLFQDGYLVNLRISVWGMCVNLDEKDLKLEKKVSKLIKLGKKMLIEPEKLNEFKNMESKARRYLYKNSYDFPIADAHFVPKKQLSEVLKQLETYRIEFEALVTKFVTNYPTYKEAILANEDYKDIVDVLKTLYPAADKVQDKFGYEVMVFELAMPQAFEETNIQELISRDEAKTEVKKTLNDQLKAQHQNSLRLIQQFTEDAAKSLRGKLVGMCSTIIEKIKNKELISKANINTIKEELDNFRALNFLDDKEVEKEIAKLDALVKGNHNFKSDEETIGILNAALSSVLTKAENLTDISEVSGKYFRKISV